MQKIIVANNLMGDSLYVLKPIDLYLERFPKECAGLMVLPGFGGELVHKYFDGRLPIYHSKEEAIVANSEVEFLHIPAGRAMEIAAKAYQQKQTIIHISEAFAFMLGVDCKDNIRPPLSWVPRLDIQKQKIAIISPFSRSCTRHSGQKPNKTLDDWKWEYIIRYLRKHGYTVQCIGAEDDHLQFVSLPLSSYRSAKDLDGVLKNIQSADLIVTIDNGTMHMAAACNIPAVVFWSSAKGVPIEFIAPIWNTNIHYVMIDDVNEIAPAILLYGLKQSLSKMEALNII